MRDIDEFKKLFSMLKSKNVNITVYDNAEAADGHDNGYALDENALDRKGILVPGCYVLCDVGEDHDSWYEARYNAMCSVFDECGYVFKFFEDPWAHMTRGRKLPVE